MIKNSDYWKSLATRNPVINKEEQREIQDTLEKQHWLVKLFMRSKLWRTDDYVLTFFFRKDYDGNNLSIAKKHVLELLCYLGLAIGCVFSLISLIADLRNPEYAWFQRSGAVMVLFALISEYVVDRAPEIKPNEVNGDIESIQFHGVRKKAKILGLVLAVVGTFIWAYGDLPFSCAHACE